MALRENIPQEQLQSGQLLPTDFMDLAALLVDYEAPGYLLELLRTRYEHRNRNPFAVHIGIHSSIHRLVDLSRARPEIEPGLHTFEDRALTFFLHLPEKSSIRVLME